MIITIRTDKPEAEVEIFSPQGEQLSQYTWHAYRELSGTLLKVLRDQLQNHDATFNDISGVVIFRGPGSFTGLRIGITVANTLAYALQIPVVGATGQNWQQDGLQALQKGQNDKIALPLYGADANITAPKK
jgi:tRNA threonylcarbamoyladenosine biosynthesis protein TsaB